MKYIYSTKFELTSPVMNFQEAKYFLLKRSSNMHIILEDHLINFNVILKDECCGFIEATASKELTKEELERISKYLNKELRHLSEDFKQQNFAQSTYCSLTGSLIYDQDDCYWCTHQDECEYQEYLCYGKASFDCETDNYLLELDHERN